MVTASHSVPGSSSSETEDWRNVMHCCFLKKVTACHGPHVSSSTENKVTMHTVPPIVAKMDTASQNTTNGSSSTKIDMTANMMPQTVVDVNTVCHSKELEKQELMNHILVELKQSRT